jgi:hypothetical protein
MFENRVLRRIFEPKRKELARSCRRNFITCALHQTFLD